MGENGNRYFTTGEFAGLCRTTKETLFYYDEINLLKPVRIESNGYRVYSSEQFFDYDLIRVLKQAGSSLKEIKWYLEHFDSKNFLKILKEKEEQIRAQRKELQKMENMLNHTIKMTEHALQGRYDAPGLERQEEEYLLTVRLFPGDGSTVYGTAARLGEHFICCEEYNLVDKFPLGSIILKEEVQRGGEEESYFFSRLPERAEGKNIFVKPAGLYAALLHKGRYESFSEAYQSLLSYVRESGLKITGNAYVYDLISYLAAGTDENCVMKISVRVGENVTDAPEIAEHKEKIDNPFFNV